MAKQKKRRRASDYAARLAARRKKAMKAFFEIVSGPKSEDAQITRLAELCEVKTSTCKQYLGGKVDMGQKACEKLQALLDAAGKQLADYTDDPHVQKNGIWIFCNPKRKVPFLPQPVREARAQRVVALLVEVARILALKHSNNEELFTRIAKVCDLKENSILMVANSCSYLSADRIAKIANALKAKGAELDLTLLGQDPRNLDEDEIEGLLNGNDEEEQEEGAQVQQVVAAFAELQAEDVLIITGSGQFEKFTPDSAAVVVLRPGASMAIHSIPAECSVSKGVLMTAGDGSGTVSVPFTPNS